MQQEKSHYQKAIEELGILINNQSENIQLQKVLIDILDYPLIQKAIKHEKSSKLGKYDLQDIYTTQIHQIESSYEFNSMRVCQCCGVLYQKQQLPYLTSIKDVQVSIGVKLYFNSLFYQTIIFIIGFLLYTIYSLATNIYITNIFPRIKNICDQYGTCFFALISSAGKVLIQPPQKEQIIIFAIIQVVMGIIFILVWSFINAYRQYRESFMEAQQNSCYIFPSNFTLMVKNVPKSYLQAPDYPQNIKKLFLQYQLINQSQNSYEIVKINIRFPLYNESKEQINRKEGVKKQLNQMRSNILSWIEFRIDNQKMPWSIKTREGEYQSYLKLFKNHQQVFNIELQQKCTIFVTMRFSKSKQQISKLNSSKFSLDFRRICQKKSKFVINGVQISDAPQPADLEWKNAGISKFSRNLRKIFTYIAALILIGISVGLSILLKTYQKGNQDSNLISILFSAIITIINLLIEILLSSLVSFQHEFQKPTQQASLALQIALFQLTNCIVVPLGTAYYGQQLVFESDGLVNDIFYIALFNLTNPILNFINFKNIYYKIMQRYYKNPRNKIKLSGQRQLNQYYSGIQIKLAIEYAYIIKTVLFTAFFMPMQPSITFITPISLGLMYAVNKYNLFYRYKRPNFHTNRINEFMNLYLRLGSIFFAAGQIYCFQWAQKALNQDNIKITEWIIGIEAIILLIFPYSCLYQKSNSPQIIHCKYQKSIINEDYDRLNPVTKKKAIQQHKYRLQKIGIRPIISKIQQLHSTMKKQKNESDNQVQKLQSAVTLHQGRRGI